MLKIKIVSAVSALTLLVSPALAFGAVVLPAGCTQDDLKIWNQDNNKVVSCVPAAQVAADRALQASRNIDTNRLAFATGTSVVLKNGSIATCPWWFPYAGCVIARSLLK